MAKKENKTTHEDPQNQQDEIATKDNEERSTEEQEESSQTQEIEAEVDENSEPTCEEKLKEAEDKFLRVHADFENIKRRLEKEKSMAIDFANESFAKDLLSVLDSLDMALQIDEAEAFDKLKEGVELTRDNLLRAFEKHGVIEIDTQEGFDPNVHEAVMQVDSEDHEEKDIVQVLQKGYTCKSRVLRPTMVSICK